MCFVLALEVVSMQRLQLSERKAKETSIRFHRSEYGHAHLRLSLGFLDMQDMVSCVSFETRTLEGETPKLKAPCVAHIVEYKMTCMHPLKMNTSLYTLF